MLKPGDWNESFFYNFANVFEEHFQRWLEIKGKLISSLRLKS